MNFLSLVMIEVFINNEKMNQSFQFRLIKIIKNGHV